MKNASLIVKISKKKKKDLPINSQLRVIKKYAFESTPIRSFFVPAYVEKIDSSAFSKCIDFEIDKNCQTNLFTIYIEYSIIYNYCDSCKKIVMH